MFSSQLGQVTLRPLGCLRLWVAGYHFSPCRALLGGSGEHTSVSLPAGVYQWPALERRLRSCAEGTLYVATSPYLPISPQTLCSALLSYSFNSLTEEEIRIPQESRKVYQETNEEDTLVS